MIHVKACPKIKTPKEILKDGVMHKPPLVMINIVKLVINQFSLNIKKTKSYSFWLEVFQRKF